jgi:hypothetical protein
MITADGLSAGANIVLAVAACRALKSWRDQYLYGESRVVARRLLGARSEVETAFIEARSRAMLLDGTTKEEREASAHQTWNHRLGNLDDAVRRLSEAAAEASLLWPDPLKESVRAVRQCQATTALLIQWEVGDVQTGERQRLFLDEGQSDDISAKLACALNYIRDVAERNGHLSPTRSPVRSLLFTQGVPMVGQAIGQGGLRCIACAEPLHGGATVCPRCRQFQAPWKNCLLYWSGVVGLISLTFTLFAYLGTSACERFAPDSIDVVEFESGRSVVLANAGTRDVLVHGITVRPAGGLPVFQQSIQAAVPAGAFLSRDLASEADRNRGTALTLEPVLGLDPEAWTAVLNAARADRACYRMRAHDRESFERIERIVGPNLNRQNASATIRFTSSGANSPIEENFEAYILVDRVVSSGCRSQSSGYQCIP